MFRLLNSTIFMFSIVFCWAALGNEANPQAFFSQGLQYYASKDYAKAKDAFQSAIELDHNNAALLTNLGLTYFQLGQKSHALGVLRKAVQLDPSLEAAESALAFVKKQTEIRDLPHHIDYFESLRTLVLNLFSLPVFFIFAFMSFFFSGWSIISFLGRRKAAESEEKNLPSFPISGVIFTFFLAVFSLLFIMKVYDSSVVRGTIIDDKVSAQTAPGQNEVAILDLYGGMEVLVLDQSEDWVQVKYPGTLTGWIKKSSIVMTR